ncbi:uncharacterized protein LOC144643119 [Oculina patagonica]
MDLNLEEDVAKPTEAGCELKRRSVKRSVNNSLHNQTVSQRNTSNETVAHSTDPSTLDYEMTPDVFDDCLVWRYTCPDEVKISWLQAAPFVYDHAGSNEYKTEEHTPNMKGIFHEVVTRAIGICCKTFAGKIPRVRFLKRAANLRVLHRELIHGLADMIIPVHSSEEKYGGSLPYVKILDSPGVVLIVPHSQSSVKEWKVVLQAVSGTWPVVLMAFLMSSVAGVFVWALDSSHNPEQFPCRFDRGAFEGFWWAFVTITTVGYGDKTPKSTLARSFAVVWILIGVTVCSVMTATLTDTLTRVKLEKYDVTTGKRIGVLRDSPAFQDAVNLAANITILEDRDGMYDSLINREEIDVIMDDIFLGIESMKRKDKSKQITIADFIRHNRAYGVAYGNHVFEEGISDCLSNVIKFRYNDVLKITSNYIKDSQAAESQKTSSDVDHDTINAFDSQSPIFLAVVVALSFFLFSVLIGGKLCYFITKQLNRRRNTKLMVTYSEDITPQVIVDKVEQSSSSCCHGQQQTEV